jgi:hypothetical protein
MVAAWPDLGLYSCSMGLYRLFLHFAVHVAVDHWSEELGEAKVVES